MQSKEAVWDRKPSCLQALAVIINLAAMWLLWWRDDVMQVEDTMQPLRPYETRDTLRQFLDHDRHVLRFFCVWDDREMNQFGDLRQVRSTWFTRSSTFVLLQDL